MKGLLIFLFFLWLPFSLAGQFFSSPTHFHFNSLAINPAFAGSDNAVSASLNYRNQWTGFKDAPKSSIVTIHSPVKSGKVGLGIQMENQSTGIYKTTGFVGNYAYRTEVNKGMLAFGLGFGATIYSIKWTDLKAIHPNDEQLLYNSQSAVMPVFSLGVYYYTKKYYVGVSLPSFLSHRVGQNPGEYKTVNDYSNYTCVLNAGYHMNINPDMEIRPAMLLRYNSNYPTQIDLQGLVGFKKKVWLGLGYRHNRAISALLQCQVNYQLRLAYGYDFETGDVGKYMNGSHEIGLNYILRYARKVMGPRNF